MDDLLLPGNGVDEFVGDDLRIQVVQADPVEVQLAQFLQQAGQGGWLLQIHAVPGDVLGDDDELLHAAIRQLPGLGQQGLHGAAAVAAPELGNDAEGAAVAAPLGDLQIGGVGRGGHQALPVLKGAVDIAEVLRLLPCHQLLHRRCHVGIAAGAQHPVHLGQLGADVVGVPLGETASHQQLFQPPGLFQFRQLQNIFDGFALGGLNEAAGVQHRHVGPVRVAGNSVPRPAAQGHHLLGVHQILGTAEGNKCDFIWHHHRSNILV